MAALIMAKCPEHKHKLIYNDTKYGLRGQCPVSGCTVVDWFDDDTATPADYETRQARKEAHHVFDRLWRTGYCKRSKLYQLLANHLCLSKKETHIGQFDIPQCEKVIEFAIGYKDE